MASLSDIIASLQNGVVAMNNMTRQLASTFPQASAVSTTARSTIGTVVFDSSAAVGFLAVTTSSGFVGWVPLYPSS